MARVTIEKVTIRLRGVSRNDARRLAAQLGPTLQRALTTSQQPIVPQRQVDVRVPRGRASVADRIATPLATALRGGRTR